MTSPNTPRVTGSSTPTAYELRVAGHLDDHWSAWLDDLTLTRDADGTTVLTGPVADQAHLHGVLARIRDLGVPLLSLRTADPTAPSGQAAEAPRGSLCARPPPTMPTPPGHIGDSPPSASG